MTLQHSLFIDACLWAVGSAAAFALFGWPAGFMCWPHRSPAVDAIPPWYLGLSLLAPPGPARC